MRLGVVLGVLGAVGCAPQAGSRVAGDARSEIAFELLEPAVPIRDDTSTTERSLWRIQGLTVTVQRIEQTRFNERASIDDIADALVTRHELGEVTGELAHRSCSLSGRAARCLSGHLEDEGSRLDRRGFLVAGDGGFFLVEVLSDASRADAAARQIEVIRRSFRWSQAPPAS